ncbi:hypothetical protein V8F06_014385 [Rhypophila decipiens]
MATNQSQTSTGITSYGPPAPTSLPTPAYDDPPQHGPDPSNKPLPPGAQDSSYKPMPPRDSYGSKQDTRYDDSAYRPLPPNQDPSLYKPSQQGPDLSYQPVPLSNDLAYHTLADPARIPYGGPPPQPLPSYAPGPNGIPSYAPPPNQPQQSYQKPPSVEQMVGPAGTATAIATETPLPMSSLAHRDLGIKHSLASAESNLREYMSMLRRRQSKGEVGIEDRLRNQASTVLGELHNLRQEIADLVKNAESHRWRRFLVGGAIASFIPIVKRLFPRPDRESETSNDTEYAFRKSKSLISRVLAATRRPGIATVAFFVFAVLYVFQNEVSLRVGRSVTKRLKRLTSKVEAGEDIEEADLKALRGWRWRVLMWSE